MSQLILALSLFVIVALAKPSGLHVETAQRQMVPKKPQIGTSVFKLIHENETVLPDYRLARREDLVKEKVKMVLTNKWAIVELEDGEISGAGYRWQIRGEKRSGYGEKLITLKNPIDYCSSARALGAACGNGIAYMCLYGTCKRSCVWTTKTKSVTTKHYSYVKLLQYDAKGLLSPIRCDPNLPKEDLQLHFQCVQTAETREPCKPPTWPEEEKPKKPKKDEEEDYYDYSDYYGY